MQNLMGWPPGAVINQDIPFVPEAVLSKLLHMAIDWVAEPGAVTSLQHPLPGKAGTHESKPPFHCEWNMV